MAGDDDGDFGASEGTHAGENLPGGDQVRPDPARVAKVGATAATVEAAVRDLAAGAVQPEELEQASLMLDEMDEQFALFAGPVRHVADAIAGARGRGRPKGATNKNAFRDVLLRMGFRHPGLNLASLANADPLKLAMELAALNVKIDGITIDRSKEMSRAELSGLVIAAQGLILKANAELMPYFEGKAAQQIDVNVKALGMMLIGEMPTDRQADDGIMDLTNVPEPE